MSNVIKISVIILSFLLIDAELGGQPRWVKGTPSVVSTGQFSITVNYGIDRTGTVYFIVYNYDNRSKLSSSQVRSLAISGPSGSIVATAVLSVGSSNINRTLQHTFIGLAPNQVHTIYAVAASSLGILQSSSTRMTASTLACPSANAGRGGEECDLDFRFNAVPGPYPGIWTKTAGPGEATFIPDARTPDATVVVTEYGRYSFTWTIAENLCSNSATVDVVFYRNPDANAGEGGNSCGLRFNLSAVPSIGKGTWSRVSGPGNATFSPDNHSPLAVVNVSQYGTYIFRWREENGPCYDEATVTVTFVEGVISDAGEGGDECDKDFQLNAVPGQIPGAWTKISGPGNVSFAPGPDRPNARVTVTEYGDYDFAWTISNNYCSSTDIIRVSFHDVPFIDAGDDKIMCIGDSVRLSASGSGAFQWSPANLLNNYRIPDPFAYPGETTLFTVTLTDQYGCHNSDQVRVEVRKKPVADAGPDRILENQLETLLKATLQQSYEHGEWSILEGTGKFDDRQASTTTIRELAYGSNIILWTVSNGYCPQSVDTVFIFVRELSYPTLITPNMDGKNDFFVIRGLSSMGKTELVVFNRWGIQVYRNEEYDNSWNGLDDKSDPLPDDTYFFILKSGGSIPVKGYIVIRRNYEKDY
ncbi:MAG: gliding motility-associated C-terminal domain-containing protein [Bacteroidales bacterium]|nr:gliding motility-associated C-terminal domain-containing protein [Bacteroidales bacterium]